MKPILVLAFLLSCSQTASRLGSEFQRICDLHGGRSEKNLNAVRIVSWNIDRGVRLAKIASDLTENPADLCLLQEVDWNTTRTGGENVAADLARALQLNGAYGIEFEELSQEHADRAFIGQATLKRLPLRSSRLLRFENQSTFWEPRSWLPSSLPLMQRRLGSRIALVTELEYRGWLLVVYNARLESRSAGAIQERQIEEILRDCVRYKPDTSVILGGDLNTKYMPSVFLHKLERAGFRSALGEHIERTHKIAMALDWVFARGPVNLKAGAVRRDIRDSDHYSVFAMLETK